MNYTYILQCSDGTYYTGWTNHLEARVKVHNAGKGAKYTRNRTPVELVYFEEFETKQEAMRREAAIKKLTRKEKQLLICTKGRVDQAEHPDHTGEDEGDRNRLQEKQKWQVTKE